MKPAAQRVRELRERRKLEGLRRVEYWLDDTEKFLVDGYVEQLAETRRNSPNSDGYTSDSTK